jgi:hypothetical protein
MKTLHTGRFLGATAAVFALFFGMEMLFWGYLLKPLCGDMTAARQACMRTEEEMMSGRYLGASLAAYLIYAAMFVLFFHFGREGRKFEGLRYGAYAWLFTMLPWTLWFYAMEPIGQVVPWMLGISFVEMLILSLVVSAIYKPRETA